MQANAVNISDQTCEELLRERQSAAVLALNAAASGICYALGLSEEKKNNPDIGAAIELIEEVIVNSCE